MIQCHLLKIRSVRTPFTQLPHIFPSYYTERCFAVSSRTGVGIAKGYKNPNLHYKLQFERKSGLPDVRKPFLVLGIESSCDDTGVAIVRSDGVVLSDIVHSQYELHEKFGGIIPNVAVAAHRSNIDAAISSAIEKAGLKSISDVDAIAVTKGPGLEVCLRVGFRRAQALAILHNKPFVTVHHLEAHCLLARLAGKQEGSELDVSGPEVERPVPVGDVSTLPHFTPKVAFPFLVMLASGGHTTIQLCRGVGDFTMLGGTVDDSLGEALDKAARMLGLAMNACSGGAALERCAVTGDPLKYEMTVPMKHRKDCDFSYSGLKNAFRLKVQEVRQTGQVNTNTPTPNLPESSLGEGDFALFADADQQVFPLSDAEKSALAAAFQHVAFTHVEDKLRRALNFVDAVGISVDALVVVGGVAANLQLRRRLLGLLLERSAKQGNGSQTRAMRLVVPPPKMCTDNGVMAAWAGVEQLVLGISNQPEGQDVIARWPLGAPLSEEDRRILGR